MAAVRDSAAGPLDTQRRAAAVAGFMRTPAGDALAASSKRVRNILRGAQGEAAAAIDPGRFEAPAEDALHQALRQGEWQAALDEADYAAALAQLAALQAPIDAFFADVMVNAEDAAVRANRLALLAAFDAACSQVADFEVLASGG